MTLKKISAALAITGVATLGLAACGNDSSGGQSDLAEGTVQELLVGKEEAPEGMNFSLTKDSLGGDEAKAKEQLKNIKAVEENTSTEPAECKDLMPASSTMLEALMSDKDDFVSGEFISQKDEMVSVQLTTRDEFQVPGDVGKCGNFVLKMSDPNEKQGGLKFNYETKKWDVSIDGADDVHALHTIAKNDAAGKKDAGQPALSELNMYTISGKVGDKYFTVSGQGTGDKAAELTEELAKKQVKKLHK